jgi:multidrug resistance efflux pump
VIYLFLVPALVAAIWAWRMSDASLENARRNGHAEFLRANKAAKEYSSVVGELMVCRKDLEYVKASWDKSSSEYAKEIEKLSDNISRLIRDLGNAIENKEKMQNQIDGLEIDKIHLKNELWVHREKQQKRREQKAASMRRFRAKNKQAKNTTNK